MFTVYILYSAKFDKTYVGFTGDLPARFISHNELGIKGWTVNFRPWEIAHTEEFETKQEALVREKWFKSGVGGEYIRNVILKR